MRPQTKSNEIESSEKIIDKQLSIEQSAVLGMSDSDICAGK